MLSVLDLSAVKSFLSLCQREIPKGNRRFISRILTINGKKITSKQALLNLGITNELEMWKYVLKLIPSECVKVDFDYNPRMDMNSEIFVFKKEINNKIVYIKLTLRIDNIICLSFHESH